MVEYWPALLALGIGYLFGSIPFGLILTRAAGLGDIRNIGSGNIGATNVLRTGHKGLAALTLLLDGLKGAAAVLVCDYLGGTYFGLAILMSLAGGLGAFLGHLYPVWLGFHGGKGVATYIGVLAAWSWPMALAFVAIWIAVAVLTRYSSLSALIAGSSVPVLVMLTQPPYLAVATALMATMLITKHRANIHRLLTGREPRIGAKG